MEEPFPRECGDKILAMDSQRSLESAETYTYFADGKLFPFLEVSGEKGFLLPVGRHNSFWLKGSAGQSFGDSGSAFGNTYSGALQCYPNYIQFCLFGHDLATGLWGAESGQGKANYMSAGTQMNIQMVLFTHMKTTLSFGYARAWGGGLNQGEFMVSLKLLQHRTVSANFLENNYTFVAYWF